MKITVKSYYKVNKGTLLGSASIVFDDIGLTMDGIKVIKSSKGDTFYAFPSFSFTDKEGQKKYKDHCGFYTKETHAEYRAAISVAFKEYFAQNPQYSQATPQQPAQPAQPAQPPQPAQPAQPTYGSCNQDDLPF